MGEKAKGWTHWSTNEKVAAVILLSVLAIFMGSAVLLDRSLVPEGKASTSLLQL